MRRLRGKTWLNFAATLLLAAFISPMADATQPPGSTDAVEGRVPPAHVHLDKVAMLDAAAKASRKSTEPVTDSAPAPAAGNEPAIVVAQIPASLSGTVYYDGGGASADPAQAAATQINGSPPSSFAVPGKWTSLLATALLFGFLFWRRAA